MVKGFCYRFKVLEYLKYFFLSHMVFFSRIWLPVILVPPENFQFPKFRDFQNPGSIWDRDYDYEESKLNFLK